MLNQEKQEALKNQSQIDSLLSQCQQETKELKQTSYTRLSVYNECAKKYQNKYVLKLEAPKEVESYFLKGKLVHTLMESFFLDSDINLDFADYLPEFIEKECLLPVCENPKDMQLGIGIHVPTLIEFADPVADLLLRAAPNYEGDDAIRNSDGSAPKDVWSYPPKSFKYAYQNLGVEGYKYAVDLAASKLDKNFEKFSLAVVVAEALFNVRNFTKPSWIREVVDTEYRFENTGERVLFDNGRMYWSGGPDIRVRTQEGALVILDYKTSTSKPSPNDVLWHTQLPIYVYLTYEQTGELAKAVGIVHLPTNDIILAGVDPLIVKETINHLQSIQDAINKEVFPKKHPSEFNSPCLKTDWKTKAITKVCPYLKNCWPAYYQDVISVHEAPNT